MSRYALSVAPVALAASAAVAQAPASTTAAPRAQQWQVDVAHSQVSFAVKHMMFATVRGRFTAFQATVETDPRTLAPRRITATIDANSITTGVEKRDGHLRSPDFLDVATYPEIRFESTRITAAGAGRYSVEGNLTIRGSTKPITLTLETPGATYRDPWGATRTGGVATGVISRKEWGLTWNQALETGGVLVGDEITLTLEVEALPAQAAAAGE
jgi:polyisoprenoid-binding protein YceI